MTEITTEDELNNKIFEIWNLVEDGSVLMPLVLIDKVNLFELIKNMNEYQHYMIVDTEGKILNAKRGTHE
jgi:hypothetical protein